MVLGADESKAHFDEPRHLISSHDQLLVLLWKWTKDGDLVYPEVVDWFFGNAAAVADLRDALHLARGGSFVNRAKCPDGCVPKDCTHHGEPLNEKGKRERVSGPEATRVSKDTSFAANFGGMIRMLKAAGDDARSILRKCCAGNPTAKRYVKFVWRHLPDEEANHFTTAEWRACAAKLGIKAEGDKAAVIAAVRKQTKYLDALLS